MTTTELIGLLGLLRELVSRKSELDRSYFEDFIEPTWELFEKVHESYKTQFREYINFVAKQGAQVDQLLEMIRRDFFYSQDLRSQLRYAAGYIPSSRFKATEQSLSDFLAAVGDYFDVLKHIRFRRDVTRSSIETTDKFETVDKTRKALEDKITAQLIREYQMQAYTTAYLEISKKKNYSRDEITTILNEILNDLQTHYDQVAGYFYKLKKEILS